MGFSESYVNSDAFLISKDSFERFIVEIRDSDISIYGNDAEDARRSTTAVVEMWCKSIAPKTPLDLLREIFRDWAWKKYTAFDVRKDIDEATLTTAIREALDGVPPSPPPIRASPSNQGEQTE